MPEPSTDPANVAAVELIRLFHAMPRQMPPAPARDITLGQMRLLFMLRHEGPQTMGRIADVFDLRPAAVTGFVTRIEGHGLVERHHRSDDRRIVDCSLTDAGRAFLEALTGIRQDVIREALSTLDEGELRTLVTLVRTIIERQGHLGRPA